MKNVFKKSALALLVTASVGMGSAQAAGQADVLGLSDNSIYAAIGLSAVTSMDCKGVNMGSWRLGLNQAAFTGFVTVTAAGNAQANANLLTNSAGMSQSSGSGPATGYCKVTGLSASPTLADYKMTLTPGTSANAMVVGTTPVLADIAGSATPAATTAVNGLTTVISMVNQTPALDGTADLYWRLAGTTSFAGVVLTAATQYGYHQTPGPATVTISAP